MGPKGRGKKHWHKKHNFWHEWHEEQEAFGEEMPPGGPPFEGPPFKGRHFRPRPPMAFAWRQFFHRFMGAWPEEHWAFGGRRFSPWHQGIDSFNPYVAALLSKGGGLLPLVVMDLLDREPRYGNEIMDLIAERTKGQWVANPGAIYPLLTMLEKEGLVEGKWADPRKRTMRIYHLTAAGEEELERLKAIVSPKLEEAIQVLQDLAQELIGDDVETPAESDGSATDEDPKARSSASDEIAGTDETASSDETGGADIIYL